MAKYPFGFATTQNNLGNTYKALAQVKNKGGNLVKAVGAFHDALKVYTLNKYPFEHATTQYNIGNTYQALAEVQNKKANLAQAVTFYQEALKVFTLGRYPEQFRVVTAAMEKAKKGMK